MNRHHKRKKIKLVNFLKKLKFRMMNHSFIKLLNAYKTAVVSKKTTLHLIYSKQSLLFVEFLLERSFISGFNAQIAHKAKILVVYIKYDTKRKPAIVNSSISSKITKKRPIEKVATQNNFIINLNTKQKGYGCLLARFR